MPHDLDSRLDLSDESANGGAFLVISREGRHKLVEVADDAPLVLGSDPSCDCVLEDPAVSRRHCRVRWAGRQLVVEPLDGARMHRGGRPLEEAMKLDPGDDLQIGPFAIAVGVRMVAEATKRRAFTHAEIRERVVEELARAERSERKVALLAVRSGFGQGARLARMISGILRSGDLLGSLGPDELEIVLADAGDDEVTSVADRIQAGNAFSVTVGYAIAPLDADDADTLFQASHRALDLALAEGASLGRARDVPCVAHAPLTQDDISRELAQRVSALASAESNLVLTGELGSGRATIARYIHAQSGRPAERFAAVAPRHARSARTLVARVSEATGGTLCVRDIDDWSLDGQHILKEALSAQRGTRIITTTTRALGPLVERGIVDAALFALLDGLRVEVPPLRSRPQDLVAFAEHFAQLHGAATPVRFTVGAFARLHAYPWPGNLIELDDAMRRAAYLASGGDLLSEHLPSDPLPADAAAGRLREHVDSVERDAIIRALADSNQNQTHAARALGLSRRALIYKMEKYGLKAPAGTAPRRSSTPVRRSSKPVRVA